MKICPQCKQASIFRISTGNWTTTEYYKCKECDYEGAFYLEIDPSEDATNFADLETLKQEFPNDLDPTTDLELNQENLQNLLVDKPLKEEKVEKDK